MTEPEEVVEVCLGAAEGLLGEEGSRPAADGSR